MTSTRRLLDAFREWFGFQRIVDHHRAAGADDPVGAALDEIGMRVELERFRDFASDQVLKTDRTLPEISDAWVENEVKPMTRHIGYDRARALKGAIKAMPPNEALHPHAYKVWSAHGDRIIREIQSRKVPGQGERDKIRSRVLRSS